MMDDTPKTELPREQPELPRQQPVYAVLADGAAHALDVIGSKVGATLQDRLIALTWMLAADLAKISDSKARKEARTMMDRQTSVNLARILSGLEG